MIIIGHELVPFKTFYRIKSLFDLDNTPSNSNIIFGFDDQNYGQLTKNCKKNSIVFAVEVYNLTQALLANGVGASYLVVNDKILAKEVQSLAEQYLFDSKILIRIDGESSIKDIALLGIDGVLLDNGECDGDI